MSKWVTSAKEATWYRNVDGKKSLLKSLEGSEFFLSAKLRKDTLVEFETVAPTGYSGPKTRKMHQVDALATRLLELLGARIQLSPSGGGNVFEVGLNISGLGRTTLGRILWGVPSGPRLVEDVDHDYQSYVPETFNVRWGIDRNDVLLFAEEQGEGADVLLDELFRIRDAWHGSELKIKRPRRRIWRAPD